MVKFATVKRAFSGGEISPYLHSRSDMEVYYGALKRSVNFVTDQFGAIHRRPGTEFLAKAKGKPCFYDYDAGADCPAVIAATAECFQFFVDGKKFGDDLVSPYGADEYCDLQMASDCGATFIVHPNHPPRFILKTEDGFEFKDFTSLPYGDLNSDATCTVCLGEGGSAATGSMTVSTDEWVSGDAVDIVGLDGTVLGTVTLGTYLGNNTYRAPFISGIPSGEYADQNGNAILLQANGAKLTAIGCEPFTELMVGQFIRVLDESGVCQSSNLVEVFTYDLAGNDPDTNEPLGDYALVDGDYVFVGAGNGEYVQVAATVSQEDSESANDPNTWLSLQVIRFNSASEVVVSYSGCEAKCTDLFCLPAYSDGVYPSAVWVHGDRLWLSKDNCFVGSKSGNFFDWEKTDPDGSVNPDNAIYGKLNAGQCQEIRWMRTNGRYLILGTDRGIHALGGSQGAAAADDTVQQLIQSVGVADIEPLSIGEDTLFIDRTCSRIFAVAPSVQYDQLAMVEKTMFADHIGEKRFTGMAFQEVKFPIVWTITEDGCLSSLTYWPNQNVRGWSRHELGGQLIKAGCCMKPEVCDVKSQRSIDGKTDHVYFAVKRTINGEDVFFIETLCDFFSHYDKKEDACYLDASVPLSDIRAVPPRAAWHGPSVPPLGVTGRVAMCDDNRWHYGVDGADALEFDAPNTTCVTRGLTMVERDGTYEAIAKTKYGEKPEFIGPELCLYDPPCNPTAYAVCKDDWAGFECFDGETLVAYLDGADCGCVDAADGSLAIEGCIGRAGYPYVSEAELLPWRADLGVSDGGGDNSAVMGVSLDVYRTPSVKIVIDQPDNEYQISEQCKEAVCVESKDIWGVSFASGWQEVEISGTTGINDDAGFIIRADGPYPAIIRAVKPIYSGSARV